MISPGSPAGCQRGWNSGLKWLHSPVHLRRNSYTMGAVCTRSYVAESFSSRGLGFKASSASLPAQQVDAIVLLVPSRGAELLLGDFGCRDADTLGRSLSGFSHSSYTSLQWILKWECIFRHEIITGGERRLHIRQTPCCSLECAFHNASSLGLRPSAARLCPSLSPRPKN